jgi:hypothetical protein
MAQDAVTGPKNEPRFSESGAPEIGTDDTIVAAYAAKVGNKKGGTDAERLALTGKDLWEGLHFQVSDGTKPLWLYTSGAWVRASETLAKQVSGAALSGITLPSGTIPAGSSPIIKAGFVHGFTTPTGAHGYMDPTTFDASFPNGCVGLAVTPIQVAGAVLAPYAIDIQSATRFRVFYPGAPTTTERSFTWIAVGY